MPEHTSLPAGFQAILQNTEATSSSPAQW